MTSHIRWRAVIAAAIAGSCVFLVVGAVHRGALAMPDAPPDIVVVMVDDLGVTLDDNGTPDNRILERLPNVRSLFLDGGLGFDSAYGELPLCCPGRAGFLTGQHPRTNGVIVNDATLLDPSQTIATVLDEAGYQTHMVGKYLNHAAELTDKTPPGWDHVAMMLRGTIPSDWVVDDQPVTQNENPNRSTATQAIEWANALNPAHPAFFFIAPVAPHFAPGRVGRLSPWLPLVEQQYAADDRCQGIAPYSPPDYRYDLQPDGFPLDDICRSLLTVDEMLGTFRDIFASRGRDTYFALTTDNGMSWGRDGWPLKNHPNAAQVPLFFAGPGIIPGRTDALTSSIDVSPTLAALAGASMGFAEGVSFQAVLDGGPAVRDWMFEDKLDRRGPLHAKWWVVRTPEWVFLNVKGSDPLLFDVGTDPWEELPIDDPAVEARLKALFPYVTAKP